MPVVDTADLRGHFQLLHELVRPEGSIKLLGIANESRVGDVSRRMKLLTSEFRQRHVFATFSVLDTTDARTGVVAGLQALRSAFFRPNILFVDLDQSPPEELAHIWAESRRLKVGLALLAEHPKAGLGRRTNVHLWFGPELVTQPVPAALDAGGMHLAVLTALRLKRSWEARLRVFAVTPIGTPADAGRAWLEDLADRARFPADDQLEVVAGTLEEAMAAAPQSDLDVLGLPPAPDLELVRRTVEVTRSACLLLGDSGHDSALA